MTPELREALNNAYQVFARYRDEYHMARTCGISRPLRFITREDWWKMGEKFDIGVLLFSDDAVLFRHFLPLWMEWLSEDDDGTWRDMWLSWDLSYHLKHAQWLNWPTAEVDAVRRVLDAWTHEVLADPVGKMFPTFLLEIEDDVSRYFDLWLDARPFEVAQWLVEQDWVHTQDSLVPWAIQPLVAEKFEAAFWANPEGERATLFSRVLQLLDSMKAS